MNKLDEIKEEMFRKAEFSPDEDWMRGWDTAMALNLPVKFAEWTQKDKRKRYANGKWGAVRAGCGGGEQTFYTDQEMFDYWLENIYKPE